MSIKVSVIDKTENIKNYFKKARLVASFWLRRLFRNILVGDRQMKKNVLSYVGKEARVSL